jgi:precorrin-6Y C5,15-methyltransferase (decarboxylating)
MMTILASQPVSQSTGSQPLVVVGLTAAGADSLPNSLLARIASADLLVGGRRHLGYFPTFTGEKLTITGEVEVIVPLLEQALLAGKQVVVLASGDPLCYGIGASLRRYFPAETLEIIPAPTAFQLAFAALAEPWSDAVLLSAHARPLSAMVNAVLAAPKAAILTDNHNTPAAVAQALQAAGLAADSPCAICENLGSPNQRVIKTTLERIAEETLAPLNVFVIWNQTLIQPANPTSYPFTSPPSNPPPSNLPPFLPGLPDSAFSTSAGQITKREIRLLALAELALAPGEILWDIGAGSGSISIEAGRAQPTATIYAIEKRPELYQHLQENLRRFPAANVQPYLGTAPQALVAWPDPHAVFIGGSGSYLAEIIQLARQRLQTDGRLVINLATLENLATVRALLPTAQIIQVQVNRATPILEMVRFDALNPVFMITWHKKGTAI